MPVLVPQQQVHAGGAGHRAEHLGHAGVQPADAGLRAQRLRRRHDSEQVDRSRSDYGAALGKAAVADGHVGRCLQGRVGPVQLADLSRSAPGEVLLAGLGDKLVADMFQTVGEVEPGRVFGDQGPVPGPLPLGGLVPGGVIG